MILQAQQALMWPIALETISKRAPPEFRARNVVAF